MLSTQDQLFSPNM